VSFALAFLFPFVWIMVNGCEYQNPFRFLDFATLAHEYYRELPLSARAFVPIQALAHEI